MCRGYTSATSKGIGALNLSYWNLHGWKSRIVGNKFTDEDFLSEIKNSDLIGLGETHIHEGTLDNLCIPGFKLVAYKNRHIHARSKTASGGLAIFAREHVSKLFVPIKTENENILWLKIKKELINENKDIFLACIYLSPLKGKNEIFKKFQELSKDIMLFQQKGDVLLIGDLNARTNNSADYIKFDKLNDDHLVNDETITSERNSEDKIACDQTGNELLDLCKSHDLRIVNGRKTGDLFGKCTSFQWNGTAVVDYLISQGNIFEKISVFKIGEHIPWLSDHCAIHCSLELSRLKQFKKMNLNLKKSPKIFKWDKTVPTFLRTPLKKTPYQIV